MHHVNLGFETLHETIELMHKEDATQSARKLKQAQKMHNIESVIKPITFPVGDS